MASEATQTDPSITVLVTGGSGYVASQSILQLLAAGYTVRTTVRNLSTSSSVTQTLQSAGADTSPSRLSFFPADLTLDSGWAEAVQGCTYVHHVASPFPATVPKNPSDLIIPARDGTLRVLRAARDAGVKRVIVTSSFAAIGFGHEHRTEPYTESDWTDLSGAVSVPAYHQSKTIAEKAAWEFISKEGNGMDLVVLNPTGIFGPVLSKDFSPSIQMIQKLIDGSIPACPQMCFGVIDVRDLADLHIRAMLDPKAKNERFIGVNDDGPVFVVDIARMIRKSEYEKAKKVPTRQIPNWVLRVVALWDPNVKQLGKELGVVKRISNTKAKEVLGWKPRGTEETILDTVESLVKFGVV